MTSSLRDYFSVLVVAVLLLASLSARADDEGIQEAIERRDRDEHDRAYSYSIRGTKADIRSDGLQFRITLGSSDGPKITASSRASGERYNFKMFIKRIVEYVPDAVDGFQKGHDQVVKIYGSGTGAGGGVGGGSTWDFQNFVDVNPGATSDRRFYAITKDGVFNISFRVNALPGEVLGGNLTIGLNDIKFDVSIDMDKLQDLGFLVRNDTELAIMGILQSRLRRRFCDDNSTSNGDEDSACINDDDGTAQGYLRWLNELNCNNTDVGLRVSKSDDDSEGDDEMHGEGSHATVVSWTIEDPYNATGICKWDPVFHLATDSGSVNSALASATSYAMLLMAVALGFAHFE